MKLNSIGVSCVRACSRVMRSGQWQAAERGGQVEVVAHLQFAVVAGVIDALRLPAQQRGHANVRQIVSMDVVWV